MFGDFNFGPKTESLNRSHFDQDPPPLSPKDLSSSPSSPRAETVTPPSKTETASRTTTVPGARSIDTLVHRLSQHTLWRDGPSFPSSDSEPSDSIPEPTLQRQPASDSLRYQYTRHDTNQLTSKLDHDRPTQQRERSSEQTWRCISEDIAALNTTSTTSNLRRIRQQTSSNPRALKLMTKMIQKGEQCNVQTSSPPSPSEFPRPPHRPSIISLDGSLIQETADSTSMEVDVDADFAGQKDEDSFSEVKALRRVGAAGIGKLRCRSALEAALSCKNMRRSAPRMRKRKKVNPPTASDAPRSSTAV
ncbi:hypothetical protein F4778DRAFT_601571 [Xylariomycetidae sp. FL2044]|nr:hypothetical protein F4778DRAFT_601571 [Xylariomycetidae sp. FL2044]